MRRHGCERPFTVYSIGAWVGQLLALVWFAIVAFGFLTEEDSLIISGTIWAFFVCAALTCWLFCQLVDPSSSAGPTCIVITKPHDSHYCAMCKKSVPGIDHHCLWLNNCVGERTYASFYFLSLLGALAFAVQIIVLALLMSVWKTEEVDARARFVFGENSGDAGLYAVSAVGIFLSTPACGFYASLFAFHTYLIFHRQITTYEYFIDKNTRERKKRAEKQATKFAAAATKRNNGATLTVN